jgi:beta-glucosidase
MPGAAQAKAGGLAATVASAGAASAAPRFHWGVASSGFQSEGDAPDSNWRRYVEAMKPGISDPYGNSVDFRHRYTEDIALARDMGVNTYRFGVEWARVEPRRGVLDQDALAFYDDVVRQVRAAGMAPMITLDHWVYPGWVADQGAWDRSATVEAWLGYARTIVTRYAGLGALWATINEPTIYIEMETRFRPMNPLQVILMRQHLVEVHRRAYDLIHELDPGALVTSNLAYLPALHLDDVLFFDRVADKLDFIGIDYYYDASVDNLSVIQALTGNPWDIEPQPDGLYRVLRSYHDKAPGLPMYVVENGMVTDDGAARSEGYSRSDHLRDHLYWVQRAKADGIDVIGYNYWSITDNYEWGSYRPRFGLYTVDARTDPALTRRPTDAVAAYRQVISDGGVPAHYVRPGNRRSAPPALRSKPAWAPSCRFAEPRFAELRFAELGRTE